MKKQMVVLVAVAGLIGLLATTSFTFAGGDRTVQVRKAVPVDMDTAAAIWEQEFDAIIEADTDYLAATTAVEDYEGDDEVMFDNLVAIQDEIYMQIAREVYEENFGAWQGSAKEFDEFVLFAKQTPQEKCIQLATDSCEKSGGVKNVHFTQDGQKISCEFTCYPKKAVAD